MWICQPLYATTIWDVKLKDWEYEPIFTKDVNSNTVEIKLQQVPPEELHEEILSYATKPNRKKAKPNNEKPLEKRTKNHPSALDRIQRALDSISKRS